MSAPRSDPRGGGDAYDGDAYFDDEHADSTGPAASPLTLLADAGARTAKAARNPARKSGRAAKGPRREHGEGSVADPVSVSTTLTADDLQADPDRPLYAVDGPGASRAAATDRPRRNPARESRDRPAGSSSRAPDVTGGGSGPVRTGGSGGGGRRPPKPTPAAARGASASLTGFLLVLFAVVIGVLLLYKGYDREGTLGPIAPPTSAESSTTVPFATNPTGGVPGGNATTVPLKPPSQVNVVVAKAGAPDGVATADSEKLKSAGYKSQPKDAQNSVPTSKVYFQPGFQGEAVEIGKVFKIPESSVQAIPNPNPEPNLPPSNVLVLLGPEARKDA